jgi:hypothetical protein
MTLKNFGIYVLVITLPKHLQNKIKYKNLKWRKKR